MRIFFYTSLLGTKSILISLVLMGAFISIIIGKEIIDYKNENKQIKLMKQQYFNNEIKGRIIQLKKDKWLIVFITDTDPKKYILTKEFIHNYYPNSLWKKMNKGSLINKKMNSFTIMVDSTDYFLNIKK